nr:hypothetical protein [Parasphaerochaeta coccoides]
MVIEVLSGDSCRRVGYVVAAGYDGQARLANQRAERQPAVGVGRRLEAAQHINLLPCGFLADFLEVAEQRQLADAGNRRPPVARVEMIGDGQGSDVPLGSQAEHIRDCVPAVREHGVDMEVASNHLSTSSQAKP